MGKMALWVAACVGLGRGVILGGSVPVNARNAKGCDWAGCVPAGGPKLQLRGQVCCHRAVPVPWWVWRGRRPLVVDQ